LNDDYTPMDFVVMILQKIFHMNSAKAVQVMLTVHNQGKAICGIYPKDIAATKVNQVLSFARQHQHPLHCTMEIHE
ncbi:ATP-dependent Clp protease adapter ClpS, partial [Candidatus Ichthyocystis hellenicum]|uniref:ATP-dependent Clp protease adapter ClpS n=1 Tax=Candidatus Ichthyocystis hellenicum TaxID=1561003 RepID=UPI000B01C70F